MRHIDYFYFIPFNLSIYLHYVPGIRHTAHSTQYKTKGDHCVRDFSSSISHSNFYHTLFFIHTKLVISFNIAVSMRVKKTRIYKWLLHLNISANHCHWRSVRQSSQKLQALFKYLMPKILWMHASIKYGKHIQSMCVCVCVCLYEVNNGRHIFF